MFPIKTNSDSQSLDQLLDATSAQFLDCPYLSGALGEGPSGQYDTRPRYRFDAFDCLTFVNTVLALVHANSDETFINNMAAFNYYNAKVEYTKRFHFMSTDWNVQNQRHGMIKDITFEFAKQVNLSMKTAEAVIDRGAWFNKKGISHPDDKVQAAIDYVSLTHLYENGLETAKKNLDAIPNGTIIEIVRPHWDLTRAIGTHLLVSHLGFVFHRTDGVVLRHASSDAGCVLEVNLVDYLHNYLESPTIKGINIQSPQALARHYKPHLRLPIVMRP